MENIIIGTTEKGRNGYILKDNSKLFSISLQALSYGLGVESGFEFMNGYVFVPANYKIDYFDEIYEHTTYSNKVIDAKVPVNFYFRDTEKNIISLFKSN